MTEMHFAQQIIGDIELVDVLVILDAGTDDTATEILQSEGVAPIPGRATERMVEHVVIRVLVVAQQLRDRRRRAVM